MSDYNIIDRRINPKGKNLPNRQKFLKKVNRHVKDHVTRNSKNQKITDYTGENVSIPIDGITEPNFEYDRGSGDWDRVLPGNKDFVVGDVIKKPPAGAGKGRGPNAGQGEDGIDDFEFAISKDEYLDIIFDDLELPDMVRKSEKAAVSFEKHRAGFKTNGNPSQLDLVRSMRNSIGRRMALRRPIENQISELETTIDTTNEEAIKTAITELEHKRASIPWIDPIDLRYKRWDNRPIPSSQAVMFCLMDVSGSMGQREKEIAKRFYLLLYLFLNKKYERVQIVFVQHTERAKEVDEQTFFYGKETGGTLVSSGLELVNKIIDERYPLDHWNIYCVQVSDGDNSVTDNKVSNDLMHILLPKIQYYVYTEVRDTEVYNSLQFPTGVWELINKLSERYNHLIGVKIPSIENVLAVFRELFKKDT